VAHKYYQRIERGLENLTLHTLEWLAAALDVPVGALLESPRSVAPVRGRPPRSAAVPLAHALPPFRVLAGPDSQAPETEAVPLMSLRAAAGSFGKPELAEITAWVVPRTKRKIEPGMFVARVVGRSMEPLIPNGAYCLFGEPADAVGAGEVLLVQHGGLAERPARPVRCGTWACYTGR